MLRKKNKKILILFLLIPLLFFLPKTFVEKLRIRAACFCFKPERKEKENFISQRLETENTLLKIEIGKLRTLIEEKGQIQKLAKQTDLLPAFVIYRDPSLWMSSFWVDVGSEDNERLGKEIVCPNSPVLVGNAVVGVIDCVGKKRSRVRLITDMAMKPSVRVARGLPQNAAFMGHVESVLRRIKEPKVISYLEGVRSALEEDSRCWYLAKGVLCGSGSILWRDRFRSLKGYGFNYDFSDSFGEAREFHAQMRGEQEPLIKENDLLVTTGMDGVFPVGLAVAEVTKVHPLREGSYSYDIEATPVVKNLDSLQMVYIIPKIDFELEL